MGALLISYQLGAELLNFGAFLAFTGVNAAAFWRYYVKNRERTWSNLVIPIAGCLVCLYIWKSLRWQAQVLGVSWLVVGLAVPADTQRMASWTNSVTARA